MILRKNEQSSNNVFRKKSSKSVGESAWGMVRFTSVTSKSKKVEQKKKRLFEYQGSSISGDASGIIFISLILPLVQNINWYLTTYVLSVLTK